MEVKFISLKTIIDRIMMSPLYAGLKFDNAVIWATDSINLLEVPEFFVQKTTKVFIEDYRGILPYDYVTIIKCDIIEQNRVDVTSRTPMRTSSDPYLKTYKTRSKTSDRGLDTSYRVEGDYIYTAIDTGTLEVAYKALPLDSDNYIMIPDNIFIIRAVESYIQLQYLKILWELGEINRDILEKKEQDYSWAVGQAQSQRQFDNLDKLEAVKSAISRLVLLKNSHETDYRFSANKEIRRI